MEKILEIIKKENILELSSEVPLARKKAEGILFEVSRQVFKDSRWLIPLFSDSGKKALLIDVGKDAEFVKGWILHVITCLILTGNKPKALDSLLKKTGGFLFTDVRIPDQSISEYADRIFFVKKYIRYEDVIRKALQGRLYDAIIQNLINNELIDCNFNLKTSLITLTGYLKNLALSKRIRVCPSCLKPFVSVGKAVRKTYCNRCLKHYKAINKRIQKLRRECFSDGRFKERYRECFSDKKFKVDEFVEKIKNLPWKFVASYPEKQKQLIAFYRLMACVEKKTYKDKDFKEMVKWHFLCENLFKFDKKG